MNSFFEAREAEKNIRDRVKKLNEQRVKTPEFRKALEKSKAIFIRNCSPKGTVMMGSRIDGEPQIVWPEHLSTEQEDPKL